MWLLYDEFIYVLRDLYDRFPWHIDNERQIRTLPVEGRIFCPITAACANLRSVALDEGSYSAAARYLGIEPAAADALAQAADLAGAYNAHVRADLTDALRLTEPWGREGRWNDQAFHSHSYPHGNDRPMARGGIFGFTARPVGGAAWLRCTTPPPIAPLPSTPLRIIDETAHLRSIMSAWSETPAARPSTPRPKRARSGSAKRSASDREN